MTAPVPFDLDHDGNIITNPLTGYSTAPVAGMCILARIEYGESDDHVRNIVANRQPPHAVQLILTPMQAMELAARFNALAEHILSQSTPSGGRN